MIDALTELSKLLIRTVNGVGVGIGAVEAQRGLAWKVCEPGDLLSEAPSPRQNPCVPADFEPDSGQAENRRTVAGRDRRGHCQRNRALLRAAWPAANADALAEFTQKGTN